VEQAHCRYRSGGGGPLAVRIGCGRSRGGEPFPTRSLPPTYAALRSGFWELTGPQLRLGVHERDREEATVGIELQDQLASPFADPVFYADGFRRSWLLVGLVELERADLVLKVELQSHASIFAALGRRSRLDGVLPRRLRSQAAPARRQTPSLTDSMSPPFFA